MLPESIVKDIRKACFSFLTAHVFSAHQSTPALDEFLDGLVEKFPNVDASDIFGILDICRNRFKRLTVAFGAVLIAHPWTFDITREELTERGRELLAHQFRKLTGARVAQDENAAYGDVWEYTLTVPEFYQVYHKSHGRIFRDLE